jgi:hypothetical protein
MSKAPTLDQVSAALRFYELAFAPIGGRPAATDVERTSEHGSLPPAPSNPQPKKDSP